MAAVPKVTLNSNQQIPILGLGTWKAFRGEIGQAVRTAIDLGYRHFDCALVYQNEQEIGEAIRSKIDEGVIKREDIFVVSKLWNTYHRPDLVLKGCRKTLKNFGLDYIDLYLMHWPMGYKATDRADDDSRELVGQEEIFGDPEFAPVDEDGKVLFSDDDYIDTWKEMEKLVELGLTKSIGVSNFNVEQLTRVLQTSKTKPVVNQIEIHPYLLQPELVAFCKENNIAVVAYCPFGAVVEEKRDVELLEHPTVTKIGKEINKSPGQVILRYLVQYGVLPIPKSTNPDRMKQNISIFDFELTKEQCEEIKKMDYNSRGCLMGRGKTHKYYPFK